VRLHLDIQQPLQTYFLIFPSTARDTISTPVVLAKNQRAFRSILSSNHHQVKFTLLVKYTTVHHSFISLPPSLLTSAMTIISTQCFIHDILTQQSEWSQKIVYLIVHLLCLNPPDSFRQNPDLFPGYHG
jgi:hypothetical protein